MWSGGDDDDDDDDTCNNFVFTLVLLSISKAVMCCAVSDSTRDQI